MRTVRCPKCSRNTVFTSDSRRTSVMGEDAVRRRRRCKCGYRWSTYEVSADSMKYFLEAAKTVESLYNDIASGKIKVKKRKKK
jgi:transcriptional regulator NrdR family protein